MQPSELKVNDLTLGELTSNQRGGKTANFANPLKLALKKVTTPFKVSSFDGLSDRKSLDLRTTPELRSFCERLDAKLQTLTPSGCKEYKSLLKQRKDYDALFRTKLTLTNYGKTNVKIFDVNKRRLSESEISDIQWRDCTMNVLVNIKGCYVQSGQWGPLAQVEAIMVKQEAACPFDNDSGSD